MGDYNLDMVCWFILCGPIPEERKAELSFMQLRTARFYQQLGYSVFSNFFDSGMIPGFSTDWAFIPEVPGGYTWPHLQFGTVAALCMQNDPDHLHGLESLQACCKERWLKLKIFYF